MGSHRKDPASTSNEEGMGSGQIRDQGATSNRANEYGVGTNRTDAGASRNEEGMGAGGAPQAHDSAAGDEYGMGKGQSHAESGSSGKKEGGLLKKVENVFKKH